MKPCAIGVMVLFDSDAKDFSIYNQTRYRNWTTIHTYKQFHLVLQSAKEAQRIADCWLLNLIGDNK